MSKSEKRIVHRKTLCRPKSKQNNKKNTQKGGKKPAKPKFLYTLNKRPISKAVHNEISKLGYIPYSWDDVEIHLNDDRIIATGMLLGVKRYLYKKEFRQKQNDKKCDRMVEFGKELGRIKKNIMKELDMEKPSRTKVIATGLWLLLKSSIRVGNKKYLKENGTYGLTTLNKKHVKVSDKHIELDFVGKKSVQNYVKVKIPTPKLTKWFKYLHKNADPYFIAFDGQRISSLEINDYIKDYYGEAFTAKDFRTWGANIIFLEEISKIDLKKDKLTPKEINKTIKNIIEHTAEMLNNTPSVLKSNYLCQHILEKLKTNPEKIIKQIRNTRDIDQLLIELL